jgi:muramoyltetrapeptide carboxypeptidase
MKRKDFVKYVSAAAFLPGVASGFNVNELPQEKVKPKRLKKGDKVGLIAPGGFITEAELSESINNLKNMGFIPVPSENILARFGYLAGTDKQRAADLNSMFSRKDISAVVCARGGYGCTRILNMIDYDLIRKNPKILLGYSDITALLYAVYAKTGLVCFHGPVGISTFNDFSLRYFSDVLTNPIEKLEFISAERDLVKIIKSGKASGELAGGNLSVIISLIGTRYDINTDGKIIFLEEINEEPYRIDRMLTQMIEAGKFTKAAGIALGIFHKCEPKEKDPAFPVSFSLMEVLEDRLTGLGIPVLYGLSFGHIINKFTIPFGVKAELNSANHTLTLLESAVL